jgi:hypothetical protein
MGLSLFKKRKLLGAHINRITFAIYIFENFTLIIEAIPNTWENTSPIKWFNLKIRLWEFSGFDTKCPTCVYVIDMPENFTDHVVGQLGPYLGVQGLRPVAA